MKIDIAARRSPALIEAVLSKSRTRGYTHTFYKYPARFSPEFARAAIETFSKPGDVVLDPFMGGGTTLVEALAAGRNAIGSDINSLAYFVARVKTCLISAAECAAIESWYQNLGPKLSLRRSTTTYDCEIDKDHLRGIPWPLKKSIAIILHEAKALPSSLHEDLVRCAVLRAAQWALDCTEVWPSASVFRNRVSELLHEYIEGLRELREAAENSAPNARPITVCLNVPARQLDASLWHSLSLSKPALVVTSPPYPKVHVLYHRWQIKGRRETPAPYWIVGEMDGHGESHYTMGSRTPTGLNNYFRSVESSFSQIHGLLADGAVVVQLLAFSDVDEQLPRYLEAMERAGFQESICDERIWRQVPSRRWYATYKGDTSSSREVLLIHRRVEPR